MQSHKQVPYRKPIEALPKEEPPKPTPTNLEDITDEEIAGMIERDKIAIARLDQDFLEIERIARYGFFLQRDRRIIQGMAAYIHDRLLLQKIEKAKKAK